MKDIKYFKKLEEAKLTNEIKGYLSGDEVEAYEIQGCTMESLEDLEKNSVKLAIKAEAKKRAFKSYQEAKAETLRFIMPADNQKLNGIELDDGIILPYYGSGLLEDGEILPKMIAVGLYTSLRAEFDEYYYKLLLSFNLERFPANIRKEVESWA